MYVSENDEVYQAVSGIYSYTDSDGKTYTVQYFADKNGYRANVTQSAAP